MRTESVMEWYRKQVAEIPGYRFHVESKSSTHLLMSTEAKRFPPVFSLKLNLTGGFLTFEAPAEDTELTREKLVKLFLFVEKLGGYLAINEFEDGLRLVLNMDRKVDGDLKLSKSEFHANLARFVKDYHRLSNFLENSEEDPKGLKRKNESSENPKPSEQRGRQVGFQLNNE